MKRKTLTITLVILLCIHVTACGDEILSSDNVIDVSNEISDNSQIVKNRLKKYNYNVDGLGMVQITCPQNMFQGEYKTDADGYYRFLLNISETSNIEFIFKHLPRKKDVNGKNNDDYEKTKKEIQDLYEKKKKGFENNCEEKNGRRIDWDKSFTYKPVEIGRIAALERMDHEAFTNGFCFESIYKSLADKTKDSMEVVGMCFGNELELNGEIMEIINSVIVIPDIL